MPLNVIILAAGQGTRMRSDIPKVLHCVAGKPMLEHVIDTGLSLGATNVHVVYGHGGSAVKNTLQGKPVQWVLQGQQLGTGHAVQQIMPQIHDHGVAVVLYGDVPLIGKETLDKLVEAANQDQLALLTAHLHEPRGYGRIVRNDRGQVIRIVEEKDANDSEKQIKEINTGFLAAPTAMLREWLSRIDNSNAQGEYYLTDVVALAVQDNISVQPVAPLHSEEILGVNNRKQLADVERYYQVRQTEQFLVDGLTMLDPARVDVRGRLQFGTDCSVDINVIFEGEVSLGNRVNIGPNTVIRDSVIGDDTQVMANCIIEQSHIGAQNRIGPFARIRPDTETAVHARVGNFVEIKKARLGEGSKVNHLSYVGDTRVGSKVNIGAGTITCNYDGANKHLTVIEDDVFVGSNTALIAPVTIGEGATIGAGSTISKDAPAGELTVARQKQQTIADWKRPRKKT